MAAAARPRWPPRAWDTTIPRPSGERVPSSRVLAVPLTCPPCTATSSVSTSMPGLVTRTSRPPRTSAWICSVGLVITASGEVELHGPADSAYLHPLRDYPPAAPRGIPALVVEPDDVFSLGCDPALINESSGRSAVSAASSPLVRAVRAALRRSSSSAAVGRPSPAATRSLSTARSLSSSEARSSGLPPAPGPAAAGRPSPVMGTSFKTSQWTRNRRTGPIPRPDEGPARDRRRLPAAGGPAGPRYRPVHLPSRCLAPAI